jgi:hypothetical protein
VAALRCSDSIHSHAYRIHATRTPHHLYHLSYSNTNLCCGEEQNTCSPLLSPPSRMPDIQVLLARISVLRICMLPLVVRSKVTLQAKVVRKTGWRLWVAAAVRHLSGSRGPEFGRWSLVNESDMSTWLCIPYFRSHPRTWVRFTC